MSITIHSIPSNKGNIYRKLRLDHCVIQGEVISSFVTCFLWQIEIVWKYTN